MSGMTEEVICGLKCLVSAPSEYSNLVVFLHGLGSDGQDMYGLLNEVIADRSNTKIICPSAIQRPISFMFGFPSTAWFDIKGLSENDGDPIDDLLESVEKIVSIIAIELEKNSDLNVIVGGFSQGAALSYGVLVSAPFKLSAVIPLSGWVPARNNGLMEKNSGINLDTPIYHTHGTDDPMVPYLQKNEVILKAAGFDRFTLKMYKMGHATCGMQVIDLRSIFTSILK